ncbi:MAG TPA: hypothetical protein VFR86_18420 [Burkholderiaceae bacterium]|nr:hypothetical protein [Burkholderiaceae bacterium]
MNRRPHLRRAGNAAPVKKRALRMPRLWHACVSAVFKQRQLVLMRCRCRERSRLMFLLPFPRCLCRDGNAQPAVHFEPASAAAWLAAEQLDLPLADGAAAR